MDTDLKVAIFETTGINYSYDTMDTNLNGYRFKGGDLWDYRDQLQLRYNGCKLTIDISSG